MRRDLTIGIVLTCALASTSLASEAGGSIETLAGWSADGERFAVILEGPGQKAFVVRERDKQLAAFETTADDYPEGAGEDKPSYPDPEKIDVEKWGPIKKYGLKRIDKAARTRFKAELVLAATGKRLGNRYECKGGGWTLKRKGDKQPIHEVKAKGRSCFTVHGGYLHAGGTRALVKITEAGYSHPGEDGDTSEDVQFVLVDLPPKP